jgi:peptide/nickel transport system substrate-binding protein
MRSRSPRTRACASVAVAALLLAACSNGADLDTEEAVASEDDPGEGDTLVLAVSREPASMLPLRLDVNAGNWRAFEGLLDYDADLELVPRLATDLPDISDDGLTVTVELRDDVTFHDGEPFTADDVVYTFTTVADPEFGSPVLDAWGFRDLFASIEALDDHTVEFTLTRPDPALLDKLYLGIAPAHLLEGTDAFESPLNTEPIGTGPYRWVETRADEWMVFEAYEGYWGGEPRIERVVYRFLADENARAAALRDGSVDAAVVPPALAQTFEDEDGFDVLQMETASVEYLTLPTTSPIVSDPDVRRAFVLGLDREAMAETVGLGRARVTDGPLPPTHWAFADDVSIPHDPEEAARLLDEAGWIDDGSGVRTRDGEPLAFTIMVLPNQQAQEQLAMQIRSDLAELGWDITVEAVESDEQNERRETDAKMHDVSSPYDPDMHLFSRHHSMFADDGDPSTNPGFTQVAGIDAALELGRSSLDRDERAAAYRDVQAALAEDLSLVHLIERVVMVVVASDIEGIELQPMGAPHAFPRGMIWNLEDWTRGG